MDNKSISSVLKWSIHPIRLSKWRAVIAILVPLLIWILIYFWFHSLFWLILAILLLSGAIWPFFVITHYQMDEQGVTVKRVFYTIKRDWSKIRNFYPDRQGVLLSPFTKPSRLENFRGLYILFGDKKEEVLSYLGKRIGSPIVAGPISSQN
ncbi:MAG: hypothetical protein AB1393_02415 [Candidatus Edwardsbacteria bacterium]